MMQVALVQTNGDFARMLELHHLETNILGGKSLRVIDFDVVLFPHHSFLPPTLKAPPSAVVCQKQP